MPSSTHPPDGYHCEEERVAQIDAVKDMRWFGPYLHADEQHSGYNGGHTACGARGIVRFSLKVDISNRPGMRKSRLTIR